MFKSKNTNYLNNMTYQGCLSTVSGSPFSTPGFTQHTAVRVVSIVAVASPPSTLLTVDGTVLIAGDRVLLTAQVNPIENGIWVAAVGAWTRPADFANGTAAGNSAVLVTAGIAHAGTSWVCTTPSANISTQTITFLNNDVQTDIAFSSELSNGNVFVAVSNQNNSGGIQGTFSIYQVNKTTGALTVIGIFPVDTPLTNSQPSGVSFTSELSTGKVFLGVTNVIGSISVYDFNKTTGIPTAVTGSPFATSSASSVSQFGKYTTQLSNGKLFFGVINTFAFNPSATFDLFPVDTGTGIFTTPPITTVIPSTNAITWDFEWSPQFSTGAIFAAFTQAYDNLIDIYSLNITTDVLTLADSKATGAGPIHSAYTSELSNGNVFLAVSNNTDITISMYQVDKTLGGLTPLATVSSGSAFGPNELQFSPQFLSTSNVFLVVPNTGEILITNTLNGTNVSAFKLNPTTGVLTALTGSPFASGNPPYALNISSTLSTKDVFAGITILNTVANGGGSYMYNLTDAPTLLTLVGNCNGTVTVTGSNAEATNTITLFEGVTAIAGTGTADSVGNFTFTTTGTLSAGVHSLTTKQTNIEGCTSTNSNAVSVTIPATPGPPTLGPLTGNCDGSVTVTGSGATATNTITVFEGVTAIAGTGIADGAGNFNFTTNAGSLSAGLHTLTVKQTNSGGCVSTNSNAQTVTIPATTPVPVITTVTVNSSRVLTVIGTGVAGDTINVYYEGSGTSIGSGIVDGLGNWNITTTPLPIGDHTITATQTNLVTGCVSSASVGFLITVPNPALPVNNFTTNKNQTIVEELKRTISKNIIYYTLVVLLGFILLILIYIWFNNLPIEAKVQQFNLQPLKLKPTVNFLNKTTKIKNPYRGK